MYVRLNRKDLGTLNIGDKICLFVSLKKDEIQYEGLFKGFQKCEWSGGRSVLDSCSCYSCEGKVIISSKHHAGCVVCGRNAQVEHTRFGNLYSILDDEDFEL